MEKKEKIRYYILTLRISLIIFILIGVLVAVFNVVLINRFSPEIQHLIILSYEIYEHEGRTLIIVFSSIITIKLIKTAKGEISKFRLVNLISLCFSMLIIYVIIPNLTGFLGYYSLFMPIPWSTAPFQIAATGAYYTASFSDFFGPNGIMLAIFLFLLYQVIAFGGTVLLGRRWHCSMICTLAGGHAESSGEGLPLKPLNKKRPKSKAFPRKVTIFLIVLQIFLFVFNFLLIAFWVLNIYFSIEILPIEILISTELYKYLLLELILMFLAWLFIGGRGYCRYCAAGAMIGIVGRITGQQIRTGLTNCTECGMCNDSCKMSIDIKSFAQHGKPVKTINCVGCGCCIEACPTHNLKYTTYFLSKIRKD